MVERRVNSSGRSASPSLNKSAWQESPTHEPDSQFAITLARGLQLLRCFTPEKQSLSNKELAQRTGLDKSTISRFSYTLCELGYLVFNRHSGRYQLGPAVLSLGYPFLATIRLRQVARARMQILADDIGGAVSIGVRDRTDIICVETCRSNSKFSHELPDIGMRHPMLPSAMGRAYLAGCDPSQRSSVVNQLRVGAANTHVDPKALDRALKEYRERGFCTSLGDVSPHVHAVGVPLKMPSTGEIFAFNWSVPVVLLKRGQLVGEIGPRLLALVRSLSIG